ncbi:class I SAM-dependent methyltransferase [Patescibacteria group bacterium]
MLAWLYVVLVLSIIALIGALMALYFLFKTRVPFVKTPSSAYREIIGQISPEADIKVIDLGCGDASVLLAIEKHRPEAHLEGYELSPAAYLQGRLKACLKKSNVRLYYRNFHKTDLSHADVVFCFLIASVMPRLEEKLLRELKPGAKVISYGFTFPKWQPVLSIKNPEANRRSKIHIYKKT